MVHVTSNAISSQSHLLGPAGEESHEVDGTINLALAVFAEAPVDLILLAEVQDVVEELVPDVNLRLGSVLAEAVAWMGMIVPCVIDGGIKCSLCSLS